MKKIIVVGIVGVVLVAGWFVFQILKSPSQLPSLPNVTDQNQQEEAQDFPLITVIAQNLDTPWGIAFLPDGDMLVTERKGTVTLVDDNVAVSPRQIADISDVREEGEGGLLGIATHPEFESNKFVYLYYTYSNDGGNTLNRVVRMTYKNGSLLDQQTIIDQIPGASNHNGGRIAFGPDGYLYIATGDAQDPSLAQDRESLAGKILRTTDEGDAAPGNPFDNRVYSYGHRNPQGIAWDGTGQLWSSEHGPSGGAYGRGNDEVNRIIQGQNYGWPEIQGDETLSGMERPYAHSGRENTWAPGGNAIVGNTLFFSGLRGAGLYSIVLTDDSREVSKHFENEYGRLREVIAGPNGMLYITTSNRDGRGVPNSDDDKIIRVNHAKL